MYNSACQLTRMRRAGGVGGGGGGVRRGPSRAEPSRAKKKNQSVKFKMHKPSACSSWLGSAASVQLDMLITSISFASLDGSDAPQVISGVAFRRHTYQGVADWQHFRQLHKFNWTW